MIHTCESENGFLFVYFMLFLISFSPYCFHRKALKLSKVWRETGESNSPIMCQICIRNGKGKSLQWVSKGMELKSEVCHSS